MADKSKAGKRLKKRKTNAGTPPAEHPISPDRGAEHGAEQNEYGGMNMSNFKKNLGCGG